MSKNIAKEICKVEGWSEKFKGKRVKPSSGLKSFIIEKELGESYFKGRCIDIAKDLVGKLLLCRRPRGVSGGIIVETEAYLGEKDPACHLSNGKTKRTIPFLKGAGTVYIFKIYKHNNLNIITEYNSHPECVLIRAIHPTHGLEIIRGRREIDDFKNLSNGPGKLTEALGITKEEFNNTKIKKSSISMFETDLEPNIAITSRIGISKAMDWPLRYCFEENPFLSKISKEKKSSTHAEVRKCYRDFESKRYKSLYEVIG